MKFQCTVSGPGFGFVYIMSYPGSDKLKIGHSLNPTARAADIGGTLAPETPILEAYFWCSERREDVERKAHVIESQNRHNGEWFNVPIEKAIEVIRQAASEVGVEVKLVFERTGTLKPKDLKTKEQRQAWLKQRRIEIAHKGHS